MKLDFSRFIGDDAMTWLYKAEKFFALYNTPDEQKVTIASIHFEGKVLPWFQLLEKAHQVLDRLSLSTAIQIQFGPSQFDNPLSDLFKLKQSSTMADYYDSFIELANQSYGLDDSILFDCFIGGLIPKHEVISRAPHSLLQAVSFAKLFEKKFHPSSLAPKHKFPYFPAKSLTQNISLTANRNPPINTNPPPLLPTSPKSNNLKRLTPADIQFRRKKEICFTCDEKYFPTYWCANKHYFLLQCEDEISQSQTQMYRFNRLSKINMRNLIRHLIYHTMP